MTFHSKRYLGLGFLILALSVVAPPAADWLHTRCQLPPGYGAAGDRQRACRIPALVRPAVEELSAGAGGSWVKESVENGAWVYEVHAPNGGKEAVTRLTANGHVIRSEFSEPEPAEPASDGE